MNFRSNCRVNRLLMALDFKINALLCSIFVGVFSYKCIGIGAQSRLVLCIARYGCGVFSCGENRKNTLFDKAAKAIRRRAAPVGNAAYRRFNAFRIELSPINRLRRFLSQVRHRRMPEPLIQSFFRFAHTIIARAQPSLAHAPASMECQRRQHRNLTVIPRQY